jgi:cytoskeleton protein RodZ
MPDIGETLREARMRARIDVSEIESKTKIRAKYLRALENEEWGLLPGPTFVKSFLRTYAAALGLDGKALVEEYRANNEEAGEALLEPIVSSARHTRGRGSASGRAPSGPSRGYLALVAIVLAVIVLLIVGLLSGGKGHAKTSAKKTAGSVAHARKAKTRRGVAGAGTGTTAANAATVTLSLRAQALVYVCLLGDGGRILIKGAELQPGTSTPTYHAKHFDITLGNSSVTMLVDGTEREVPASSQAIGYSITKARGRLRLRLGQLPTCK